MTFQIEAAIRPLVEADRPHLVDMISLCGKETRSLFSPIGNFYRGGGAGYFLKFNATGGQVYVATVEDALVGLAYLYRQDLEEGIAYFGVLVADPYQRRGIGTRLMEHLEAEARGLGYRSFRTSGGTHRSGPLRRILNKRGYVDLHVMSGNIVMEKRLV